MARVKYRERLPRTRTITRTVTVVKKVPQYIAVRSPTIDRVIYVPTAQAPANLRRAPVGNRVTITRRVPAGRGFAFYRQPKRNHWARRYTRFLYAKASGGGGRAFARRHLCGG